MICLCGSMSMSLIRVTFGFTGVVGNKLISCGVLCGQSEAKCFYD
jgi:hypothetical protein